MSYARADITTGLVGWWTFDSANIHWTSSTTATTDDLSGNGNTGTLNSMNQSTSPVAGPVGQALNFDGISSNINFGNKAAFNLTTQGTISIWIKGGPGSPNNNYPFVFGNVDWNNDIDGYGIVYDNGILPCFVLDTASPAVTGEVCSSGRNVLDNTWHLVTATWNLSSNSQLIYIDGALQAVTVFSPFTVAPVSNLTVLSAGMDNNSGLYPFAGSLDDARIYNRALSSADVAQLYAYTGAPARGGMMASTNYTMQSDSINFGGGNSSSTNYRQESTFGEVATGMSSSTNYIMGAGYQQMQTVVLSLVPPSAVTMSPNIGGVTGGTSNGSTTFTVTTDDPAGYSATIQASSSPALVNVASSSNSFADYAPGGSAPDFTFSITNTASAFAFSPQGADADQRYLNNGASTCNSGTNSTAQACWDGLSTSPKTIADRTSNNTPAGTQTVLYFRAASGSRHIQANGTYIATTTLTVLPL